jgi:hypothetical protein
MSSNTFQYSYANSFGIETATNQAETDKQVLKALSQNHKESTLTFGQLLKKLKTETHQRIQKEIALKKLSLSADLSKSSHSSVFLYPATEGFDKSKGEGSVSAKLQSIPYSELATRRELSMNMLALTSTLYQEDCSLTPQCKDCQANGPYSVCQARSLQKHQSYTTIPLNQYWQYALYGHTTES